MQIQFKCAQAKARGLIERNEAKNRFSFWRKEQAKTAIIWKNYAKVSKCLEITRVSTKAGNQKVWERNKTPTNAEKD